jgi:hypothetical protein
MKKEAQDIGALGWKLASWQNDIERRENGRER